jgi:hypothetical protein
MRAVRWGPAAFFLRCFGSNDVALAVVMVLSLINQRNSLFAMASVNGGKIALICAAPFIVRIYLYLWCGVLFSFSVAAVNIFSSLHRVKLPQRSLR